MTRTCEIVLAIIVVSLVVVTNGTDAHKASNNTCDNLCKGTKRIGTELTVDREVMRNQVPYTIVITWTSDAERAASAVFAQALRLAGYHRLEMHDGRIYKSDDPYRVVMSLGRGWQVGTQLPKGFLAQGVVPKAVHLYQRIAQHLINSTNINSTCEFRGGNEPTLMKVYIPKEWKAVGNRSEILAQDKRLQVILDVDRSELHKMIYTGNETFLFVDTDIWTHVQGVSLARLCYSWYDANNTDLLYPVVSFRYIDNIDNDIINQYARLVFDMFMNFSLTLKDIRNILEYESYHNSPEQAVCTWATTHVNESESFCELFNAQEYKNWVAEFFCNEDSDINELKWASRTALSETSLKTYFRIYAYSINCSDDNELLRHLVYLKNYENEKDKTNYMNLAGVIAAGAGVANAAMFAEHFEIPLLVYDETGRETIGAIGGNSNYIALAFTRLLHACKWRRVAIISEETSFSRVVSDEMHKHFLLGNIGHKEVFIPKSRDELNDILGDLTKDNVRIFIINADANVILTVLSAAAELDMTPSNGYVWLAREGVNMTTQHMENYVLSFTRHFHALYEEEEESKELNSKLFKRLSKHWQGRVWPKYATSIINAMFTLREGFVRLIDEKSQARGDLHAPGTVRHFWSLLESKKVPGLNHYMEFNNRALKMPFIYVEHWNASGGHLVDYWKTSDSSGDKCPIWPVPSDGTHFCLWPTGDPFTPKCNDSLWGSIIGVLVFAIASLTIIIIIYRKKILAKKPAPSQRSMIWYQSLPQATMIQPSNLKLLEELGKGSFGQVLLGMLREPRRPPMAVAAKALREGAPVGDESEFVREARILSNLDHAHIIKFVGVCIKDDIPFLLMEHAFFGDLLQYLRSRRHLAENQTVEEQNIIKMIEDSEEVVHVSAVALTRLAREAAEAVAYLAGRGIVHRDLRAANCLVDKKRALKLGDFGMARTITGPAGDGEYACRRRALFPVLWMAPESLARGVFTSASDVWALGVLILELVTLGGRPFGSKPPVHVLQAVLNGGRAPLPIDASAETRWLTLACWQREPASRPEATTLVEWLKNHPRALRPALQGLDEDTDSGCGEAHTPEMDARESNINV